MGEISVSERINQSQIYAEVYAVLSVLGADYISKIPQNIFQIIDKKRDKEYELKLNEELPLEEQTLSKEAIALLASIKLDYWCETEQEKQELCNLLRLNDEKQSGAPLSLDSKKAWIDMLKKKATKI